jgi:hypothetical protein
MSLCVQSKFTTVASRINLVGGHVYVSVTLALTPPMASPVAQVTRPRP